MEKHKNPTTGAPLETHNDPEINRSNQDHQYPGYPHYPAREDVLEPGNDQEKVGVDTDHFSRNTWTDARDAAQQRPGENKTAHLVTNEALPDELLSEESDPDDDELASLLDPNADVTEEDLALLGDPDLDPDGLDDEGIDNYEGLDDTDFDGDPLNERAGSLVADGDDLDLPGEELDNSGTAMNPDADEENDYYSLGGDKDLLEDDQAGENF